ncbi:MAG: carbohydrate kinase family protein [Anaerolineae bacterium]|nr:carbohydrate kinase family protein [Anaerolineae bacterium]
MTTTYKPSKICIVAGHICLDVIPAINEVGDFASTFRPGRLIETGPVLMATGGAVSNTGQTLYKLGIDTRLMGKIGNDAFGQATLDIIQRLAPHLTGGMHITPDEASSYTIILSPPGTDRLFLHCPGPNDTFGANDIDYDGLEQADLFHFGYPPLMKRFYQDDGAELITMFRRAKSTGVTTSLDMAMPDPNAPSGQANWPVILKNTLPFVDLFVPSIEEVLLTLYPDIFAQVSEGETPITPQLMSNIATDLLAMGAKIVLLKAGHLGMYLRSADAARLQQAGRAQPLDTARWANREFWVPNFQTKAVGTTGAGDSAIAGFLAALLRDLSPAESVTVAAAVGACNVEAHDALSGIRSWEETIARINAGWPRPQLDLDSPGWRFDTTRQLWLGPHDALNKE